MLWPSSRLRQKVQKIRARFLARPMDSQTLEDLVTNECKEAAGDKKKKKATEALMWLLRCVPSRSLGASRSDDEHRGLDFTAKALRRSVDNQKEELSVSFTNAYENSLRQHHSFVVRPIFGVRAPCAFFGLLAGLTKDVQVAMKACPYRATFYEKLTGYGDAAQTQADLEKWLAALETIVSKLQSFLAGADYTKGL